MLKTTVMVEQLVFDVAEITAEVGVVVQVKVNPVLLLTERQFKAKIDKLTPIERS